jgi:small ligand-binding sensory domain FIST
MPNSAASRLKLARFSEPLVKETARSALEEAGGRVSCAVAFCTADYREHFADFAETLQLHAHIPLLIGCSSSGLVGTGAEAESGSGFSLLLLHLPHSKVAPFSFSDATAPAWDDPEAWRRAAGGEDMDAWILLADPLSVPVEKWLATWSAAFPGTPCIGGLASGGMTGEEIFVFRNRDFIEDGCVAIGLRGGVQVRTLVSQGCRPIGEALPVTAAAENIIQTLGSRPACQVLEDAFQSLSPREKERARGNLFAGLATTEYRDEFHRGDFLIRNILGADQSSGAVAVAALPRIGQTIQYQLRDGTAADEELHHLAGLLAADGVKPFASLLFSCGGRGRALFGTANHDAAVLAEYFTPHPSAGFFCNGEIGPVGGKNFVHGYTASAALLC